MPRWSQLAAGVLLLPLLLAWHDARADTTIRLFQSHVGNVNFVGTQKTIRDKSNNQPCRVFSPAVDRSAALSGIPATATILSAQLYWAGSGKNPDFNVIMDGATISAPSDRRYYSKTIGNNFNYFSGAADVTAQVKAKRNNTYAFRGLTVDYDSPYCAVEGVLGGFSLVVIYSDPNQPFRMLNLYEGFQYMRYSGFTLNLSGFRIPDPIGTATGRIGHVTWEGDATLGGSGEDLLFNNYELTDSRNPSGNQFNSKSSVNGDDASYGIDFDAYTVGSPVIKSGQTTASTRYQSGQDLVLLSAEVVALPNIPLADMSISMQLNGELVQGKEASYTISVSNAGPSSAGSPTVVTSTLPAGLDYVSGSGLGWACSSVGRNVTCTNNASVPAGASLAALTLTVRVSGTGEITASALVSGKTFDQQTGNNAASVKATVISGAAQYVFTYQACKPGLPFGHAEQTCTKDLPALRAGEEMPLHITALSGDIPAKLTKQASVPMAFALSCNDPDDNAGVAASVGAEPLSLCPKEGVASPAYSKSVSVTFAAGSASAAIPFTYRDVGLVKLLALIGSDKTALASPTFVSVPYEVRFTLGTDGLSGTPLHETSPVFQAAGSRFKLEIGAYAKDGGLTPNFGKEKAPVKFLPPLVSNGVDPDPKFKDAFDAMEAFFAMKPAVPHEILTKLDADAAAGEEQEGQNLFIVGGKGSGNFSWRDVGVVKLTPVLSSTTYLGKPVTLKDGYARFIPHHFTTTATVMECVPNMKCERDLDVDTAAYSLEPISVTVTAMAEGGKPTTNYHSVFARDVVITAWAVAAPDQERDAGFKVDKAVEKTSFNKTQLKDNDGTAIAVVRYDLTRPFDHTAPPPSTWTAPTSIYLRAAETGGDGVTSKAAGDAFEVGVRIVSGRLLVPSAHGSERLVLPLKLNAQYWTGTNWELSKTDTNRNQVYPDKAVFLKTGGLALEFAPAAAQWLNQGVAVFGIRAVPVKTGTADLIINHIPWLPSTIGRIKLGTHKSPLIYLRELH